uniref:Uncharacterized protein n=1 Tax=Rhizophora mucronata TaxID=61149 RepID=A0A2P2NVI0_RHIMU
MPLIIYCLIELPFTLVLQHMFIFMQKSL